MDERVCAFAARHNATMRPDLNRKLDSRRAQSSTQLPTSRARTHHRVIADHLLPKLLLDRGRVSALPNEGPWVCLRGSMPPRAMRPRASSRLKEPADAPPWTWNGATACGAYPELGQAHSADHRKTLLLEETAFKQTLEPAGLNCWIDELKGPAPSECSGEAVPAL